MINNNGICKIIQTDNGKEFDNTQMKLFCENNNIKFIKSSPYLPQSNRSVKKIHKIGCEYLMKRKKILQKDFNIEICLDEYVIEHNNTKHSVTGFKPNDIRFTENQEIIKTVNNNILKSLSKRIKTTDKNNIFKGCFILISTKIIKKGDVFKSKNTKGKHTYRIPSIFIKFINSSTVLLKSSIKYKNEFKKDEHIKCDINAINWVDKYVYNFFMEKIMDNYDIDLDEIFDEFDI